MVSSMVPRIHRRRYRHPAHIIAGQVTTFVLAVGSMFCLAAASMPAPDLAAVRGATTSMRPCASAPAPATVIPDIPWPQQRYDLDALSQINDGTGVTVAVLDSGVDASHPQLAGSVTTGNDMLDPKGDPREDCVGHGTAVASIIAAHPVAGSGLRGLAPGVKILPIRVSQRAETDGVVSGDGNVAELAAGITAAVTHKPKPSVVNLSIATTTDNPGLRSAVQAALDADIVVVAAVGNQHEHGDPTPYPASYPGVLGVGAIGPDDTRLGMSQTGSYVDIVAPGDQVVAAAVRGGHVAVQGTSFAVPFVTATAALIRARWPALHREDVVRRLLATADPAAGARPSPDYGYGVLNPMRALTDVLAAAPAGATGVPQNVGIAAATPSTTTPGRSRAIATASVLLVLSVGIAGLAAAVPAGRRRRWRPGRNGEDPSPSR